jgi:hypothetical protein
MSKMLVVAASAALMVTAGLLSTSADAKQKHQSFGQIFHSNTNYENQGQYNDGFKKKDKDKKKYSENNRRRDRDWDKKKWWDKDGDKEHHEYHHGHDSYTSETFEDGSVVKTKEPKSTTETFEDGSSVTTKNPKDGPEVTEGSN